MPDISTIILFAGIAFLFALSPGPNFIYVLTRALAFGRREGLVSVLGIVTGGLIHTFAAVLGLSAILLTSSLAFNVVKYAGAAYLIYLGIKTLVSAGTKLKEDDQGDRGLARAYRQGFVTMLLNPKSALYFFSFLPQFVDPSRAAASQLMVFGLMQVCAAFTVYTVLVFVASWVRKLLISNKRFQKSQRYVTGFTYVALGASIALGGRK